MNTSPPMPADLPETADIETSSPEYARRFAGPAGEWMLQVQTQIVTSWLASHPAATILDVGGGHGQLALPLAARQFKITVLGSAPACAARIQAEIDAGAIRFASGPVLAQPFPDRSFEVALSIRLLPHCAQWRPLITELCRVARQTVIVDYPTSQSLNCFAPALFGAKQKIEQNTRPFALFRHADVTAEFTRCGFVLRERRAQFFLPMVLHRMLNTPALSAALEGLCRGLGLTRLFGSPILARYERDRSKRPDTRSNGY